MIGLVDFASTKRTTLFYKCIIKGWQEYVQGRRVKLSITHCPVLKIQIV